MVRTSTNTANWPLPNLRQSNQALMNKETRRREGPGAFEEYDGEGEDVGGETEGEQATEDNDQRYLNNHHLCQLLPLFKCI